MRMIVKLIGVFKFQSKFLNQYRNIGTYLGSLVCFYLLVARIAQIWVILYLDASLFYCSFSCSLCPTIFEVPLQLQDEPVESTHWNLSMVLNTADVLN